MAAYIKISDRNKPWAKKMEVKKRELKSLNIRSLFRIYCEGENTEPYYFKSFRVNTETKIEEIIGLGRSKTSLVERVIELLNNGNYLIGQSEYDENRQLWVVFDFDRRNESNEKEDFNNAIKLALANGIRVAYSNDSFELWFVLHLNYIDIPLTRQEYYETLSRFLNINYEKHGKEINFAKSFYDIFREYQEVAIRNSKRLHNSHGDYDFCDQNPCTTVYMLVEELNKCLKR